MASEKLEYPKLRTRYNQKSDMWSLGVILYEMTMLAYPFVGETLSELVANILVGRPAPLGRYDSRLLSYVSPFLALHLDASPLCPVVITALFGIPCLLELFNFSLLTELDVRPRTFAGVSSRNYQTFCSCGTTGSSCFTNVRSCR